MLGRDLILALKRKFRVTNDAALAKKIGVTGAAIAQWRNRRAVTPRQVASLTNKAAIRGASEFQAQAIRPLVEFFPIAKSPRRKNGHHDIFTDSDGKQEKHPYRDGLKTELKSHHGVYLFFDSRGQVIYAGKARKLFLWTEINNAFNRTRGQVQTIKRVKHPTRRVGYKSSDEKARQIRDTLVPIHELAHYFSAYVVDDKMINDLEALLVRSFANDLLNIRMERFGRHRSKTKRRKGRQPRRRRAH